MTSSTPLWRHPEFAVGAREMRDVALGIGAWGLVAGVAMSKAGLGAAFAIAMSLFVFAGSAQLAALPLMVQGRRCG
jgi:predicted branched-subunit amino acid permease